jgi:predicted MPP superfamily phosphohydrolase
MSKTVIIGDIHGRDSWKQIIKNQNPDRVVFVGDYFDSYDNNLTAAIQLHNFQEIIAYKQSTEANVIMLIGNHDYHYYPGGEQYSGYQYGAAPLIRQTLNENKHHLQMCYQLDDILFSHAGIGYNWLVEQNKYTTGNIPDFVNDLWTYKPGVFRFTQEIIAYKQSTEANVIMLIGNHDYHYYPGGEQYSGYQYGAAPLIRQTLNENKHHLQMCYQLDDILFSSCWYWIQLAG